MTVRSAGRRARLTGVGCTRFGEIPGSSWLSLHADAAREALADAGLVKADIDGIICAYSLVEPHLMPSSVVAEYLGLRPAWSAALMLGGATGCAAVMQAALVVESGRCRHVLVVAGDNRLSDRVRVVFETRGDLALPQFERSRAPDVAGP
jgi:3-oxoacyl-[acyl-carrier-protein] synthase III